MNILPDIKLVALDMDGTITQHKTRLDKKNKAILEQICEKYNTVIVGAGSCFRIFEQLNYFKINIIGNYGMQEAEVFETNGGNKLNLVKNIIYKNDENLIKEKVNKLRKITGYTEYQGETVEFHESGAITFPLLGTNANIIDKLSFDQDRVKRRKIYDIVKDEFKEFTVFIGGTSSFDIVPIAYNKYTALINYARKIGINQKEIIYFGDDYGFGGNDEHIYKSDIRFIKVNDYSKLDKYVKVII